MPVTRTYCLYDVAKVPLPFELSTRTAGLTQNPDYLVISLDYLVISLINIVIEQVYALPGP